MIKATVTAIASYLPAGRLSNAQLADELGDWSAERILEKTGIATRAIAGADECASDLAVAAAQRLFAGGHCAPEDIDFLLFCTQSPDYFLPATACLLQARLGLRTDCGAIDFNQGCSGFVYGLALAKSLVESGTAARVLLITADTYSKFINPRDRSTRTIFGDGAAATLVVGVEAESDRLGPFVFGTDGSGAPNLIVPAGGLRRPHAEGGETPDDAGNWRSPANLYMNGPEIFSFSLKAVPLAVNSLLRRWNRPLEAVDFFIFHQANRFMLERLRNKLKIPEERFWIGMEHCGNTVSSTIPIALQDAVGQGRVQPGTSVMVVGFGVGYSWAAAMVQVV